VVEGAEKHKRFGNIMREQRSSTRKVSPNDGHKGSMDRVLEELEKDYDQEERNSKKKESGPVVSHPIIVSPSDVDRAIRRVMNTKTVLVTTRRAKFSLKNLTLIQNQLIGVYARLM